MIFPSLPYALQIFLRDANVQYLLLSETNGVLHLLLPARALLDLRFWLQQERELVPTFGLTPRSEQKAAPATVDSLTDGQFLRLSGILFEDQKLCLYFYNSVGRNNFVARSRHAPIRHCCFDAELAGPGHWIDSNPPTAARSTRRQGTTCTMLSSNDKIGPIDVVYTWVDSSDLHWQSKKSQYAERTAVDRSDNDLRYLSRDELRYSIRSVRKFAPWVRNIFIVTDDQVPNWLDTSSPDIRVVSHSEIFKDKSALPVFNSHAIECNLHRISGLAEHFVYFNDDVFLGKPILPEDFFTADGRTMVFLSPRLSYTPEYLKTQTAATDHAFLKTIEIIRRDFEQIPLAKVLHTPHPMRKSILEEIESRYPNLLQQTSQSRIRSASDINLAANFFQHYCVATGRAAVPGKQKNFYTYIDTGESGASLKIEDLRASPKKFFCLNLSEKEQVGREKQLKKLQHFFRWSYPRRSKHELPAWKERAQY